MPAEGVNPGEIEIVGQGQYHESGTEVDLDSMNQRPGGAEQFDQGQQQSGQAPQGDEELQAQAAQAAEAAMQGQQAGMPPAEPEWRAPLGEAVGGLASELRQWQQQFEQRMFSAMQQQRHTNQPTPTPPKKEEQHPFDDPYEFINQGADPRLVKYFQVRDQRYKDQINQLQEKLNGFQDEYTRTQQGTQMAQYFGTQLESAMQQTKLDNGTRQFLEPMMLGLALTSKTGNPYSVNVSQAVSGFARWLQARDAANEQAWKAKYSKAASAQQARPAPAPTGSGTMPSPAGSGGGAKNGAERDALWDSFEERWNS